MHFSPRSRNFIALFIFSLLLNLMLALPPVSKYIDPYQCCEFERAIPPERTHLDGQVYLNVFNDYAYSDFELHKASIEGSLITPIRETFEHLLRGKTDEAFSLMSRRNLFALVIILVFLSPLLIGAWLFGLTQDLMIDKPITIEQILEGKNGSSRHYRISGTVEFPQRVYEGNSSNVIIKLQKPYYFLEGSHISALAKEKEGKEFFLWRTIKNGSEEDLSNTLSVELEVSPDIKLGSEKRQTHSLRPDGHEYIWNCTFPDSSVHKIPLRFELLSSHKGDKATDDVVESNRLKPGVIMRVRVAKVFSLTKTQVRHLACVSIALPVVLLFLGVPLPAPLSDLMSKIIEIIK